MKTLPLLLLICICTCFYSCSLGFARNEEVIGKYHIIAIDVAEDAMLGYDVGNGNYAGIVPAEVLAYCHNKSYIFVKQNDYGVKDDSSVNYYIVPIVKDTITFYPEGRIIGPLKETEFNMEISKLKISDLEFEEID